jgi:enamine deaminase RidA (YjgF/YER057c/UK114 family)
MPTSAHVRSSRGVPPFVAAPLRGALLLGAALLAAAVTHAAEPVAPPNGARQQSTVVVPTAMKAAYENWGYAPAIVTRDGTIYVSGVVSGLHGTGSYEERYAAGFERALDAIGRVLKEAGASLDDVVDITTYHTDLARQLDTAVKVRMKKMNPPHPAWTAVGTSALAMPDGQTEIRVIAKRREP